MLTVFYVTYSKALASMRQPGTSRAGPQAATEHPDRIPRSLPALHTQTTQIFIAKPHVQNIQIIVIYYANRHKKTGYLRGGWAGKEGKSEDIRWAPAGDPFHH